eukprot:Filipodium_phascolosomae@DN7009_c0_g1_i1.p1
MLSAFLKDLASVRAVSKWGPGAFKGVCAETSIKRQSLIQQSRFVAVQSPTRRYTELLGRIDDLGSEIMKSNWSDSVNCGALDVPFWLAEHALLESEINKIRQADPSDISINPVTEKFQGLERLLDVFVQTEDLCDHMFELVDLNHRTTGLGGTGLLGSDQCYVQNIDEHIKHLIQCYSTLKKRDPEFSKKIEESAGAAIAALRSKYKFEWDESYKWFY